MHLCSNSNLCFDTVMQLLPCEKLTDYLSYFRGILVIIHGLNEHRLGNSVTSPHHYFFRNVQQLVNVFLCT